MRDFVSGPAGYFVSDSSEDHHAHTGDHHDRAGIPGDLRSRRRRYQSYLPSGRNAGRLYLFAARLVSVQRQKFGFRLEDGTEQEEISSVHEQEQGGTAFATRPLGELKE